MTEDSRKSQNGYKAVAPFFDLGLRFAVAIIICAGGGYWLDARLKTLPLFLILGLFLGMTSGFITIYRAVYSSKKTNEKKGE
ncbi:MAG: AtpZ/AtpI family protein [bacterium]